MARSPKQYPDRPVPQSYMDYLIPRVVSHPANRNQERESIVNELLYTSQGIEKMNKWCDSELAFQRQNDCPPNCTDFEYQTHPELKK